MRTRQEPIVVGVDGSPPSLRAARWAADEAVSRRLGLRLLHCADVTPAGYPSVAFPDRFAELVVRRGAAMLDATAKDLASEHPRLEILTLCGRGDPRRALVRASGGARLTVVGASGGRIAKVFVGSVALHVTAHAESPVAVIPLDCEKRGGPIVVGIDGSENSEGAIGYAFDEAAVRGVGVVAVLAKDSWPARRFADPVMVGSGEVQPEHAVMDRQLAGWREKFPDVQVDHYVFHGPPADCLRGFAEHAPPELRPQMVVGGSRGRGPLTGLLLGSTGHALIAQADCPVVVVRPVQ